ncbi:hypothetical protein UCRPC4_g04970 [Phaeomoniella chlamydospora]|uniref:endo-1,3(4)-beta-glucanase n=1 Tax=Phaeomoniella chlamydospora TaxID=158046 RepID=A0A0G2GNL0_PHACM|nr:hypothetical protein UCRPC4_g04970 [Phaeomoniella chlamydospora]
MLTSTTSLLTIAGLVSSSIAGYTLQDDYSGSSFFSMFDFFTDADPTSGFVDYVDQSTAQNAGLISTNNGSVYIGVDYTNVASSAGRQSVRLTSSASYNHGLVILDLEHMPGGICGTWPAFWMLGPDWPTNGEIDISEGVNSQTTNDMTLHTAEGCSISSSGTSISSAVSNVFSGTLVTSNCYVDAEGQSSNAGCQIEDTDTSSYGTGFNSNGGGVYAMNWDSDAIKIWFFSRGEIPSDISSGSSSPDPSGWGDATASFQGGCDIDSYFKDLQIVFDTTFCGSWAGEVWSSDSTCSVLSSTCNDYVQNNPSAFQEAYWQINSLKVYSSNGTNSTTSSSTSAIIGSTASLSIPTASSLSIAASSSSSSASFGIGGAAVVQVTTTTIQDSTPSTVTAIVTATETLTSAIEADEFPDPDAAQTEGVGEAETLKMMKREKIERWHRHLGRHVRRGGSAAGGF